MENEETKQNPVSNNIKTIHTYSSDMVDAVRANETSVIKIALAEQKKKEMEALYKKQNGTKASRVLMILFGLVLIALAIWGSYLLIKKKEANNVVTKEDITKGIQSLISYDSQSLIDTTNVTNTTDLVQLISNESEKAIEQSKIKSLFLTKVEGGKGELTTTRDFLSMLKVTAPDSLIRSLEDSYMLGLHSDSKGETHPFMLFATKDYNQTYAGMLTWEKILLEDMFPVFGINVSGENIDLLEKPWRDIILDNKDARILYDDEGNDLLYYLFINKSNFIIADNKDTIREVTTRILAKKIKPL